MDRFYPITRLVYGGFWLLIAVTSPPEQKVSSAAAFWQALVATGFMAPLLGVCYFAGGVLLLFRRTAPFGLALLTPAMVVIVLFNAVLVRAADVWVPVALLHAVLLWRFRAAYAPMWNFREEPRVEGGEGGVPRPDGTKS